MSIKSFIKQILVNQQNKRYEKALSDVRMTYQDWLSDQQKLWAPKTVPDSENTEFVILSLVDGEFSPFAADSIRCYFDRHPEAKLVYGDEDMAIGEGHFDEPWFKPDWSPDLLDSCLYFGSYLILHHSMWKETEEKLNSVLQPCQAAFSLYRVTDIAVYESWLHESLQKLQAYQRNRKAVGHISQVLFHAENVDRVQRYLQKSEYLIEQDKKDSIPNQTLPLVSVIIPSKDQPTLLKQCICALMQYSDKIPLEIIVVDNGSDEKNKKEIETLTASYTYLYQPMEFHFSKMCNMGAHVAKGELLLFLNDDVVMGEHCLSEMVRHAVRAYTGAVGVKLLYPESNRIQHAGITNLPMGPVHKLQFKDDSNDYYFRANRGARNCLAVTAACLMVSKGKYEEVGGFSDELRVAFNDVDFCYSLYEAGYFNVCLNDVHARHHESLSRGNDEPEEKLKRLLRERQKLYELHPDLEGMDPYYSENLGRNGLDTGIRPAYETAGNQVQQADRFQTVPGVEDCREDDCLMARVESFTDNTLTGFGVVLGDNNACYDRELLLIEEEKNHLYYGLNLQSQYRPDLVENLPDQERVGLCGFQVKLSGGCVPQGRYRVGMIAKNKVTGLKLLKLTNRVIVL